MFSYKFLWYTANLNLVQIEHVMEQTVKERIMEFISREKIPVYRKLDQANRMVIDYVEGKIELD